MSDILMTTKSVATVYSGFEQIAATSRYIAFMNEGVVLALQPKKDYGRRGLQVDPTYAHLDLG